MSRAKDILQIDLYDDIIIRFRGKDITPNLSKKSIGMIVYLLCMPYRQVSKSTLKDMFWTDSGENAAYNLRFNLWNIKKNIPEVNGENFIQTYGGVCRINPDYPLQKSGLDRVESLQGNITEEDLAPVMKSGNRMVFMEHFYLKDCDDFNDWLALERNNRERRIISVLSRAEQLFEEKKEYNTALEILERMVFLSPYEDDFYIKIMNIQAKQGNYSEAIKAYRRYSDYIRKELGVGPSKDMKEAYESISHRAEMEIGRFARIKDKAYTTDYAGVGELLRDILGGGHDNLFLQIDNWDGLDKKSKELIEALVKDKIITIGR